MRAVESKGSCHPDSEKRRVLRLALPNNQYPPAQPLESCSRFFVPRHVPRELSGPLRPVCRWRRGPRAACVPVPETPVHEDHRSPPWENDVGRTGQVTAMESEPIPKAVQRTTYEDLGSGVLLPDPGHRVSALSRGERIGHRGKERARTA
jgi:hypothetical protein